MPQVSMYAIGLEGKQRLRLRFCSVQTVLSMMPAKVPMGAIRYLQVLYHPGKATGGGHHFHCQESFYCVGSGPEVEGSVNR